MEFRILNPGRVLFVRPISDSVFHRLPKFDLVCYCESMVVPALPNTSDCEQYSVTKLSMQRGIVASGSQYLARDSESS